MQPKLIKIYDKYRGYTEFDIYKPYTITKLSSQWGEYFIKSIGLSSYAKAWHTTMTPEELEIIIASCKFEEEFLEKLK